MGVSTPEEMAEAFVERFGERDAAGLLALYLQFDAQPDKLVFERTGVSGIRFFVWDSQFGRFFNTGPIRNTDGNPAFFVHVFLWAFLPWVAVAFAALARAWRGLRTSRNNTWESPWGLKIMSNITTTAKNAVWLTCSSSSDEVTHTNLSYLDYYRKLIYN